MATEFFAQEQVRRSRPRGPQPSSVQTAGDPIDGPASHMCIGSMDQFEMFQRLATALAIGAVVGVERHWRDARLTKIFEGTSEIQLRIVSDRLLS